MATPEDLATLWSFVGGLRCVLTPVDGGWQIRIEDDRETIKAHVAKTSNDALAIAEQWLRDYPDGTRPVPPRMGESSRGVTTGERPE